MCSRQVAPLIRERRVHSAFAPSGCLPAWVSRLTAATAFTGVPENSSLNMSQIVVPFPAPQPSMASHSFRRKATSSMMGKAFSCLALSYPPFPDQSAGKPHPCLTLPTSPAFPIPLPTPEDSDVFIKTQPKGYHGVSSMEAFPGPTGRMSSCTCGLSWSVYSPQE